MENECAECEWSIDDWFLAVVKLVAEHIGTGWFLWKLCNKRWFYKSYDETRCTKSCLTFKICNISLDPSLLSPRKTIINILDNSYIMANTGRQKWQLYNLPIINHINMNNNPTFILHNILIYHTDILNWCQFLSFVIVLTHFFVIVVTHVSGHVEIVLVLLLAKIEGYWADSHTTWHQDTCVIFGIEVFCQFFQSAFV